MLTNGISLKITNKYIFFSLDLSALFPRYLIWIVACTFLTAVKQSRHSVQINSCQQAQFLVNPPHRVKLSVHINRVKRSTHSSQSPDSMQ